MSSVPKHTHTHPFTITNNAVNSSNLSLTEDCLRDLVVTGDDWQINMPSSVLTSALALINILNPIGNANAAEINTAADDHFTITNNAGTPEQSHDLTLTDDYLNGLIEDGGNWDLYAPSVMLNGDGLTNVSQSAMLSAWLRPGAGEISTYDLTREINGANSVWDQAGYSFYNQTLGGFNAFVATGLGKLNNYQKDANTLLNIDPLVLDLTGAGIQLTNYTDANVLFNMDSDDYKEQTGWIKNGTGFLVMDKNGDGTINDVSEIFSEYFTGGAKNEMGANDNFLPRRNKYIEQAV